MSSACAVNWPHTAAAPLVTPSALDKLTTSLPTGARPRRVVRVGLLGLGRVGQAVLRVALQRRATLLARGVDLHFEAALVRDPAKLRRVGLPGGLLTTDTREFLTQHFDVVIEALGGTNPAAPLLRRLLGAGVPVATANKSVLAAHGSELRRLARETGTPLRIEASALAGVPFLGTLARRPFAAQAEQLAAILSGTGNYVLGARERDGLDGAAALAAAQAHGYAEPDPEQDLNGRDAAEKLVVILGALGAAELSIDQVERTRLDAVGAADFLQARDFGGRIKPVAWAVLDGPRVAAFVGPAFVPTEHPLARIDGVENAIRLRGPALGELLFAGPGAGPDVTGATLLDDVVELAAGAGVPDHARRVVEPQRAVAAEPVTPWLVRLEFGGPAPALQYTLAQLAAQNLWPQQAATRVFAEHTQHWVLTTTGTRSQVEAALDTLRRTTGCRAARLRGLEN